MKAVYLLTRGEAPLLLPHIRSQVSEALLARTLHASGRGLVSNSLLTSTVDSCDLIIWTMQVLTIACRRNDTTEFRVADLLGSVEGSVIIIAACIPLLQSLLERVRDRNWSTKGDSQNAYPNNSRSMTNQIKIVTVEVQTSAPRKCK